ncbi:M1 family peptidase, partial [Actinomadura adrarensis]
DARFTPGADGLGDRLLPKAGNGGYDAGHYDIKLDYQPQGRRISGTTEMSATAKQNLSRFNLDFAGNTVRKVTVNRAPATWRRSGQELVVTPRKGLRKGSRFTVAVTYDGSPDGRSRGWIRTEDGAVTLSQPEGSATWFPLNDHPSDKATFSYTITAPEELSVLANGEPVSREQTGGQASSGQAAGERR